MSNGRRTQGRLPARFWALAGATASANAADGLVYLASPLLVLTFTSDPLAVALPTALMQIAQFVFGAPIGVMIDRIDRRRVMLISGVIRATLVLLVAVGVGTGRMNYPLLVSALVVLAVFEIGFDSAATASVPEIVTDHNQLEKALGRIGSTQQVVQGFVAGPIAPVLFALSAMLPYAGACVLYAAAAVQSRLLRGAVTVGSQDRAPTPAKLTPTTRVRLFVAELGEGVKILRESPGLRVLLAFSVGAMVIFSFAQGAFSWYLIKVMLVPKALLGVLFAVMAVGGIAGSVFVGRVLAHVGRFRTFVAGVGLTTIATGALAAAPSGSLAVPLLLPALFGNGVGAAWWTIGLMAARQRVVPASHLGRVNGLASTVSAAATAAATILGGIVSGIDGRLPWLIATTACITLTATLWKPLHRVFAAHLDQPAPAVPK